jgi:phage protein D
MADAPAPAERTAFLSIWIDGQQWTEALGRVTSLRIDERADEATSFQLCLDMAPKDGDWDPLDDGRFALLHRVTIQIAVGPPGAENVDDQALLVDGYITVVEPVYGEARVPDSKLELYGLDASCLMHLEEKTKNWANLADSDIVTQIYQSYGFGIDVDATAPVRDDKRGTMIQRGTDAEFIRMLARRNGYEAWVEAAPGDVQAGASPGSSVIGHFHLPRVDQTSQPAIALTPHVTPTMSEFRARWESHHPTVINSAHIDERTRRIRSSSISTPRIKRLGATARADIIAARLPSILPSLPQTQAVGLQYMDVPHDVPEVDNLCWSDYLEADWLVSGRGTVNGLRYPQVLRSRRPVDIVGAGKLLDGTWYVKSALHKWDWAAKNPTYEVDVELQRNALNGVG